MSESINEKKSLGKRVWGVLKPASISRSIRPSTELMISGANRVIGLAQETFKPEALDGRLNSIENREHRFKMLMNTKGITEKDLPSIEKGLKSRFVVLFLLTVVALFWAIISPVTSYGVHSYFKFLDYIWPVMFAFLLGSRAFAANVALYRIRRRSLVPLSEFYADKGAWLGAPPSIMIFLCALIGTIAGVFTPGPALAQSALSTLATMSNGTQDLSLQWIQKLFPTMANLAGGKSNPDTDILRPLFQSFNSILLAFGAALLSWHTLMGIVNTAHEGKIMGQRWHQIWAPIRVVTGVTLLAPIKGYCLIQMIAIVLLVSGYNMANGMWSTYISHVIEGKSIANASTPGFNIGVKTAQNFLQSEVCWQTANTLVKNASRFSSDSDGRGSLSPALPSTTGTPIQIVNPNANSAITLDGFVAPSDPSNPDYIETGAGWDYGVGCGKLEIVSLKDSTNNGSARAAGQIEAFQAFDTRKNVALTKLVTSVRQSGLVENISSSVIPCSGTSCKKPDIAQTQAQWSKVVAAGEQFNSDINTAGSALIKTLNQSGTTKFVQLSKDLGWASAGALNFSLVKLMTTGSSYILGSQPSFSPPKTNEFGREDSNNRKIVEASLLKITNIIDKDPNYRVNNPSDGRIQQADGGEGALHEIARKMTDGIVMKGVQTLSLDTVNPMSDIQGFGSRILMGAEGGLLVWATASGAAEAGAGSIITNTFGGAFAKGFLGGLASLIAPVLISMFIFGIVETYILPMVPYFIWMYAVISCATLAVEIVIAAPLAAFLHIKADGQELINQEQRTIWVMMFNALMRPSLLLFGLVTSNILFGIMASYVNQTVGIAMLASQGGSFIGLVGIIAMLGMVVYLHYQLATRCMELVHLVPSTVSRILGADEQDRGEKNHTQILGGVANFARSGGSTAANAALAAGKPKDNQNPRVGGGKNPTPPATEEEAPSKGDTA